MSSDLDAGWEAAGVTWRTDEHQNTMLQLARRVRIQSDQLQLILAGEVVLTLLMLGASGAVIMRQGGAGALRVGAMVLLYTAAIWAFTLWNRRGVWAPYGETTLDFLALLRVRAQRRIQSAWFSQIVICLAMVVMAREIAAAWREGEVRSVDWVWIGLSAYSVAVIVWGVWTWRRARREIRDLDALEQGLSSSEAARRVAE